MRQMAQAGIKGAPPMRPLFFDFPNDPGCNAVDDQFMFGPDLLVAPILRQGVTSRNVYLPVGAKWTDAWTGKPIKGGQTIQAEAPLDKIPLYLRDGMHCPFAQDAAQHSHPHDRRRADSAGHHH